MTAIPLTFTVLADSGLATMLPLSLATTPTVCAPVVVQRKESLMVLPLGTNAVQALLLSPSHSNFRLTLSPSGSVTRTDARYQRLMAQRTGPEMVSSLMTGG